jgi:hypothetical protein
VTETIGAAEDGAVRRTRRPLIDWRTAAGEDGRTTTTVDGGTTIAGTDEASAADEEEVATAKADEAGRREIDGRGTTTKIIRGRTTAITMTTFERKEAVGGAVDEAGVEAVRDLPRNGRATTTPTKTYTARVDTGRTGTTKDTDMEGIDTTVVGVTAMAGAAGGVADTAAEGVVDEAEAEDAVVRRPPPKAVALGRLLRPNPRTTGVAVVLLHHRRMPLRLPTIRLRWSRHRPAVATAVVAGSVVEDGVAGDEEEDEPTSSA